VLNTLNLEEYPRVINTLLDTLPCLGRVEAFKLIEVILELAFSPRPKDEDRQLVKSLGRVW
jgi:hypothetical protein